MSNPILDEFLAHTDKNGLVQPHVGGGSQNGVLYTGESMIVLQDNDAMPEGDRNKFFQALESCLVEPGLLKRTPSGWGGQEGQDDYLGYTTAAFLCGRRDLAEAVLAYGLKPTKLGPFKFYFVYNNNMPGTLLSPATPESIAKRPWYERWLTKLFAPEGYRVNISAWRARMPQVTAHFYWCANETPPFLYRVAQALIIWHNSRLKGQEPVDTWMLTWLMIRAQAEQCWMGNLAAKQFYKNMHKVLGPEGLKNLNYIGGNHPITKWWIK